MFEFQGTAADAAKAAQAAADAANKAASDAARAAQDAAARPATIADLSQYTARQLRARLQVLKDERANLADRRGNLAADYEKSTGANRDGMDARLRILDNNIVQYEAQMAAVSNQLARRAGDESIGSPPPLPGRYGEDDIAGAVFGTFLGTALLAVLFFRRYYRRKFGRMPAPQGQNAIQSNERLDRIEQAVDTIAVEIERVSENQRFMTRLMTETQLAGTIAAVRNSTDMAKQAAEPAL